MDFHSMKRKELQALCKKHGIPANLTNLEMANKLASVLKEKEKPAAKGKSCFRSTVEQPSETLSDCVNRQSKKVKFSPENETFEFLKSEVKPEKMGRGARRRSTSVVKIENITSAKNVGNSKFTRENLNCPIRLTRSRGEKVTNEGESLAVPDAAETKRVKRGSRSVPQDEVSMVEARVTRRNLENKEVEYKKEVTDDARLIEAPTKKTTRQRSTKIGHEVSEIEAASRAETEEVNADVDLKKNQSQRSSRSRVVKSGAESVVDKGLLEERGIVETQKVATRSKRNTKQIEDNPNPNLGLGEIEVVRRGRTKRQRDQSSEDVKVTNTKLETSTDIEAVSLVEESSRRPSRYSTRRQSIMPHTEKLAEYENMDLVQSRTVEDNVRLRKSSTRCKLNDVSEAILAKNDAKKKTISGKRETVLEEESLVIEESTLVEEAARRSSRNNNRRQSIKLLSEKTGADGSKGRNEKDIQLKSSDFEDNAKPQRSYRHKSVVVSDTKLVENVSKNKPTRSGKIDQELDVRNAEVEGSSPVEVPPKKLTRKGAKAQKNLVTVKTNKAVTRKKLPGTTRKPNAQFEPVKEIIPVVEQVVLNSQPTEADISENNIPITISKEVSIDNADEETQGETHISGIDSDAEKEVNESKLSQDCEANDLALPETEVELERVKDMVPPKVSLGEEECSEIEKPDCIAKAAEDLDLQNKSGMMENNEMKIQGPNYVNQTHKETQAKLDENLDLEELEMDENNDLGKVTDLSSAMSHDEVGADEDNYDSNNSALLESEVALDGVKDVVPPEASHGEEESSQIDQLDCIAKADEDLDLQNKLKMVENNDMKIEAPDYVKQAHEETQAKLDRNHDLEKLEVDENNGSVLNKKADFVNEEDEDSSYLDASYQNITTYKVEQQQQPEVEVEISPIGSNSLKCTNSSSWMSVEKRENGNEEIVLNNSSEVEVEGLVDAADPRTLDIDVLESVQSPRVATPISVSNEIRSLMMINLNKTPASKFGKTHNHVTSASTTVEQVEVLNKVTNENTSECDCYSPLPLDKPSSMFTSSENFEMENPKASMCMENQITTQEGYNSGEQTKIHSFHDSCSIEPEKSEGTETEFPANYDTSTAENEIQPFQATSSLTAMRRAGCEDVIENVQSPCVTGRDDASTMDQKHSTRSATPLSISNEIKNLMLINLTPPSEFGKLHNSVLPEALTTSTFGTVEPVEDLNKVKYESTSEVLSHSPLSQEDHRTAATPLTTSNEIKSLMLINLDRTPASELGKVHNVMLQEAHTTSAFGTVELVEDLNKVNNESISKLHSHSPFPQDDHGGMTLNTPLTTSNEIKSLMLINLDRTPASELRTVHNELLQEGHTTSAFGTVKLVEDLSKVNNESTSKLHSHSSCPQEDHGDKPGNLSSLCEDLEMKRPESGMWADNIIASQEAHDSGEQSKRQSLRDDCSTEPRDSEGTETQLTADYNTEGSERDTQPIEATPQTTSGRTEHQGNPSGSIEVSPTELRLLFGDKEHKDDIETKGPESGMLANNLVVSQEAHDSGEQSKSQNLRDDCSTEPQESEGTENESTADYNNANAATPQTTSGQVEHQGNASSNIEVSPTDLRLLFDDKEHEDGMTLNTNCPISPPSRGLDLLTESKNDDECNDVDLCFSNNFNTEEETGNAVTQKELLSPNTQVVGSYDDNFADTTCVESKNSPSISAYKESASKSIHTINLLEEENEGIGEMGPDNGQENAPRETNTPGDSNVIPAEAEGVFTSSIRKADFGAKDQDDVQLDNVNSRKSEEPRPVTFDKLTTEIEDEDLVHFSRQLEGDVTQVDEGMFDDLDGHEMEMVHEMFQAEEVDSDSKIGSSSDSDHFSSLEKDLMEDNSFKEEEIENKEKAVEDMANLVYNEASKFECSKSSVKLNMREEEENESDCYKSGSKGTVQCFVESNEYVRTQNLSQASQSWSPDPEFGHSQDRVGSDIFSSWELNLFSEGEATKSTPIASKIPITKEEENIIVSENQWPRDSQLEAEHVDISVNPTDSSSDGDKTLKGNGGATGDANVTDAFDLEVTEYDTSLEENIPQTGGEMIVDEATELCKEALTSSKSVDLAVHGGRSTEDLVTTNQFNQQIELKSSKTIMHEGENILGTSAERDMKGEVMFEDKDLAVSSLFNSEQNNTEVVASEITPEETMQPEYSEELKVETGDAFFKEQSFDDVTQCTDYVAENTEVRENTQDFTPNTTGDNDIAVSSSFDEDHQPFEFTDLAVKEGSAAKDTELNLDAGSVENESGKENKGEVSAFENSTILKTWNRSSLIQATPKKLSGNFDMKENATGNKRENLGSATAKSTVKRRALMELRK